MGKTAIQSQKFAFPHVTVPIEVLSDIMRAGRNQSISQGKMVVADQEDTEAIIDKARRRA